MVTCGFQANREALGKQDSHAGLVLYIPELLRNRDQGHTKLLIS